MTYDNNGNLTQFGRPDAQPTVYRYDGAGRISEVDDPLGHKSLLQYDANGHVSQVQNDFGTSYYTMDAAGNIQQVKDAGGAVTNLTYDGNVNDVTDPNLNHTTFKDDSLGHVVRETDALGNHIDYQYDDAGRLHLVTDRDGRTITYSYDADGHRQSVTPSDSGALSFGYDGFGRLIEADNADAKVHLCDAMADSYGAMNLVPIPDPFHSPTLPVFWLNYVHGSRADRLTPVLESLGLEVQRTEGGGLVGWRASTPLEQLTGGSSQSPTLDLHGEDDLHQNPAP